MIVAQHTVSNSIIQKRSSFICRGLYSLSHWKCFFIALCLFMGTTKVAMASLISLTCMDMTVKSCVQALGSKGGLSIYFPETISDAKVNVVITDAEPVAVLKKILEAANVENFSINRLNSTSFSVTSLNKDGIVEGQQTASATASPEQKAGEATPAQHKDEAQLPSYEALIELGQKANAPVKVDLDTIIYLGTQSISLRELEAAQKRAEVAKFSLDAPIIQYGEDNKTSITLRELQDMQARADNASKNITEIPLPDGRTVTVEQLKAMQGNPMSGVKPANLPKDLIGGNAHGVPQF